MHRKIEDNLKVMAAFDLENRGRGYEARKIAVQGIAAFLASASTEAELSRTLDRLEPFERRMWWRKALKGKRTACGGIFGQVLRLTVGTARTAWGCAELDRLARGGV